MRRSIRPRPPGEDAGRGGAVA
uniref:Uncharacterized protein n=1 Tax=Arundo donax TaxID=35708 RepID=A0A0A8YIR5_ARUDO